MRVLALLEATSISGTGKAVLEMGREVAADLDGQPEIKILTAIFTRETGIPDNNLTKVFQDFQVPFRFIREKRRFDASVIPQIRQLRNEHAADLVWTNSVKSHFLVQKAGLRQVCKWVAFHHGYTSTDFKMRFYNQMDRLSLRHADRVLTVCQPFAAQMKARGVAENRIRIQHMPVRPFEVPAASVAKLRNELRLPNDSEVILSIGRLSHEKGHCDLIAAFEQLATERQKTWLVLVGDGPERGKLQQQASRSRNAANILFTGHRDDAKTFYFLASIFALPSYTEGTPNVILEAMAAGVPVVATAVGGIPELVTEGQNALLVQPRKPQQLANALEKLLQAPGLRNELIGAARQVVASHTPRIYFEGLRRVFIESVDS